MLSFEKYLEHRAVAAIVKLQPIQPMLRARTIKLEEAYYQVILQENSSVLFYGLLYLPRLYTHQSWPDYQILLRAYVLI